jgi:hypothetical protein
VNPCLFAVLYPSDLQPGNIVAVELVAELVDGVQAMIRFQGLGFSAELAMIRV